MLTSSHKSLDSARKESNACTARNLPQEENDPEPPIYKAPAPPGQGEVTPPRRVAPPPPSKKAPFPPSVQRIEDPSSLYAR